MIRFGSRPSSAEGSAVGSVRGCEDKGSHGREVSESAQDSTNKYLVAPHGFYYAGGRGTFEVAQLYKNKSEWRRLMRMLRVIPYLIKSRRDTTQRQMQRKLHLWNSRRNLQCRQTEV